MRLSLLLITAVTLAGESVQPPIAVTAAPIAEPDGQVWRVAVTVGNNSPKNITGIRVSVLPCGTAAWEVTALAPSQFRSNVIALNSGGYRSLAVAVDYTSLGTPGAIAAPVTMPDSAKPASGIQALIPIAAGALIGLLGALMTSLFTFGKERFAAQLLWKRFLVEKYDTQYREFLTRSAGIVDAAVLRGHLANLDQTALVPQRIRDRIATGIAEVERATAAADKLAARDKFLVELRSILLEPFRL